MMRTLTSNKEKARLESLQEDHTLSPVDSSQKDQHCSRLQRLADLGGPNLLGETGLGLVAAFDWVVRRLLGEGNYSGLLVEGLLDIECLLRSLGRRLGLLGSNIATQALRFGEGVFATGKLGGRLLGGRG